MSLILIQEWEFRDSGIRELRYSGIWGLGDLDSYKFSVAQNSQKLFQHETTKTRNLFSLKKPRPLGRGLGAILPINFFRVFVLSCFRDNFFSSGLSGLDIKKADLHHSNVSGYF